MPYLVLILHAGRSIQGHERNALLAVNVDSGALAGAERYSEQCTAESALDCLMKRQGWKVSEVCIGPEFTLPARELFRLTDDAVSRARLLRKAARKTSGPMDPLAPLRMACGKAGW